MPEEGAGPDGAGAGARGGIPPAGSPAAPARNPGDQGAPGDAQTGEVPCRDCGGSGLKGDDGPCPVCGGTGRVVQIVGDA